MAISSGTSVGPYELVAPIGAGGMGEVWKARDSRMGREVAIKVLPAAFAVDAERLRRFEQEARTAGSLNHPNLVTIHDLGSHESLPFIAMELLEGETLREKMGEGASAHPIPYRKALEYAAQLASGLAAAHARGVVHRDLKPENIFVTRDGRLKILDFGLAKLARSGSDTIDDESRTQQKATSPGTVLGTVGYMSPEQVRGQEVDHRSDIFSFGAILYELLTGQRAFRRDSSVETMNAILHDDPPELSSATTQPIAPAVDRIIRRCLEKSPDERFQSASDLAFALEALSSSTLSRDAYAAPASSRRRKWNSVSLVALVIAASSLLTFIATRQLADGRAAPVRLSAEQLTFSAGLEISPSVSPDGKTFLFVKGTPPNRRMFLQRTDGRSAIALSTAAEHDDHDPMFSPDGDQIVFRSERDGGGIFVMGATGESVRRLTNAGFNPSWTHDGAEILYTSEEVVEPTTRSSISSMSSVNVATGESRTILAGDVMQPNMSPNGKRIVYWGIPADHGGQRDIFTVAASGDASTVVRATNDAALDWNPVWVGDGSAIIFVSDRGGTMNLWRLDIDEESGQTRGEPQLLGAPATAVGRVSVSRDGKTLVFESRSATAALRRGTFDGKSKTIAIDDEPVLNGSLLPRSSEPSPDGKWIAFTTDARQEDLYVMSSDGTELRQLTNDAARDRGASWSPDSSRIYFYSTRGGGFYEVWSVRHDGSGIMQHTSGTNANFPVVSPDGRRLTTIHLGRKDGTMILPLRDKPPSVSEREPLPLLPNGEQFWPTGWSPDGTRVAGQAWTKISSTYVYSLDERSYKEIEIPLERTGWPSVKWCGADCLLVSRGYDVVLHDLRTGDSRVIAATPRIVFDREGHHLVALTASAESDLWQMRLSENTD